MSVYTIKDLEHLSGIKAHTLRIWEQRYELVTPKRTETNIRYYDDKDLKLILNVSLLKDHGYKISNIAKMPVEVMNTEVLSITEKSSKYNDQIQALTLTMIDLDEDRFEKIISTCVLQLGFEKAMIHVIYPLLSRVGYLWQTGTINPAQEHFISHLIRQKLMVAIDGQMATTPNKVRKFVLFLPEGELHEIPLLFANYLIKSRGHKVVYLGQSLPFQDLKEAFKMHRPDYILSVITTVPRQDEIQEYINLLGADFSEAKILLSGNQVVAQDLSFPDNIVIINKVSDLLDFIKESES